MTITPNLSLLLIMACFWMVFLLVSTQLVKPLGSLLEERQRIVREGADRLGAAHADTRELMAQCERQLVEASAEGQKERAALRSEGEGARRARFEEARASGHERLSRLAADLERAGQDAREQLRLRSRELAVDLATKLLGRKVAS